jgi:hypothetical protein
VVGKLVRRAIHPHDQRAAALSAYMLPIGDLIPVHERTLAARSVRRSWPVLRRVHVRIVGDDLGGGSDLAVRVAVSVRHPAAARLSGQLQLLRGRPFGPWTGRTSLSGMSD